MCRDTVRGCLCAATPNAFTPFLAWRVNGRKYTCLQPMLATHGAAS